jgi:hypothetical protein
VRHLLEKQREGMAEGRYKGCKPTVAVQAEQIMYRMLEDFCPSRLSGP